MHSLPWNLTDHSHREDVRQFRRDMALVQNSLMIMEERLQELESH